ncbi:MAG: lipoprotein-releasing ABC transporter permease subunit [Alphaproteobacteria bacterium]|nr:lipoprotein-releasing ABC transporter permease subunit [Alphaproteobacteria bacterium]
MFSAFERMVAMRYLRARRKEGFVSVIAGFSFVGIALGVATLIVVMAVMNGFRQDIMSRILGVNGHIDVSGTTTSVADFDDLALAFRAIPGVTSAVPMIHGQAMATGNNRTDGVLVRGMRGEDLAARPWIAEHILEGSLDAYAAGEGLAIGSRMAERFGLRVGGSLTLISPSGQVTAFGTVPRVQTFKIAAVFNVGMSDFDSSIVFMPLAAAQTYYRYPDSVTNIELHVENPDTARAIARSIGEVAGPGRRVLTWEQTNGPFFNALQVERNVMFLILTLIILVAAFNIISGLIMLVKDKARDIAILRTMGAASGSIMRIFFMAGASIGTVGTLLGFGLGLVICENIEAIRQFLSRLAGTDLFSPEIYYLSQLPAEMRWSETGSVVVMSLVLSFLATLYPSWRAARTDPVEALRYE